jgi:hypothetical protein
MKHALLLVFTLAGVTSAGAENARGQGFDVEPLARLLAEYVDEQGRVNYAALKQSRAGLDRMVEQFEKIGPGTAPKLFPTRESRLAYWINAYNVWILRMVVDAYPTPSITRIGLIPYGAFFIKRVRVDGRKMTLRSLENDILRGQFREPRIHFAINCASISCPPLAREVYRPEKLEEQLDAATRAFVNNEREVVIDTARNRLALSKIFDWYKSDFTETVKRASNDDAALVEYLKRYLTPERRRALERLSNPKIEFLDYDWGLNDQTGR